jgi:hypothetical protein
MAARSKRSKRGFFRNHSLGLGVGAILATWLVLYRRNDPSTHIGAFYGNAIADWFGTFTFVMVTKYCYEIGSEESRTPRRRGSSPLPSWFIQHSLTIVLGITGVGWGLLYWRMDAGGKWGQVVGNILSEWTQLLGLVVMTKYMREAGSKE